MYTQKETINILTTFKKYKDLMIILADYSKIERYLYDHDPINKQTHQQAITSKELEYINLHFDRNDEATIILKSLILLGKVEDENSKEYQQGLLEIYSRIYKNFGLEVVIKFKNMMLNCYSNSDNNNDFLDKIFEKFKNKTFLTSLTGLLGSFIAKNKNFFHGLSTYDGLPNTLKQKINQQELLLLNQTDSSKTEIPRQRFSLNL